MKIFTIVSAVPMEHYKHQKGFDCVLEYDYKDGKAETKCWIPEAQYHFYMFMQEKIIGKLDKKDAEKLLDLIEEFGQEKYCEGSNNEAMNNSEDI